jgi:hypothetical protein
MFTPTLLQLTISTNVQNLPKLHHSFHHLKPVSQSMAKPSLNDMQNDSDKQLAAPEHASDSWPETTGLSMRFDPSTGMSLRGPLTH